MKKTITDALKELAESEKPNLSRPTLLKLLKTKHEQKEITTFYRATGHKRGKFIVDSEEFKKIIKGLELASIILLSGVYVYVIGYACFN